MKNINKLFCEATEYEDLLVDEEPSKTRRFVNIDQRINDKVKMRANYEKWYPSLNKEQIDILMQQYFYCVGQESTNDSSPIKERVKYGR